MDIEEVDSWVQPKVFGNNRMGFKDSIDKDSML